MSIQKESHRGNRGGWLRAAVLGADDGVVSTASLMIGVAAASASETGSVLVAGVAGLVAGALSMAAGEYVSVSSQRDAERSDIVREKAELANDPAGELEELAAIYRERGLDPDLAMQVAVQLSTAEKRLTTHVREELGLDASRMARPFQAALVSAASFAGFAFLPIAALLIAPTAFRTTAIAVVSLTALGLLGALGGRLGGAPMWRAALRVILGGGTAMAVTALIGHLFAVTAKG